MDFRMDEMIDLMFAEEETPVKPAIIINDVDDDDLYRHTLGALIALNERDPVHPVVFVSGGELCRFVCTEETGTVIRQLTVPGLRGVMMEAAAWVEEYPSRKGGITRVNRPSPERIAQIMLARGEWPGLPTINGVICAPVFAADGALHDKGGYNPKTKLYYADPVTLPKSESIDAAKELLFDTMIGEFPFKDKASKAHAIALLLLPFVRLMIDGSTPLHLIDAPLPGTGKGLLIKLLTMPSTGGHISTIGAGKDDEEWGKRLLSSVMERRTHIMVDNIPQSQKLDSHDLARAITESYAGRILGKSKMASFGMLKTIWCATGNNVQPTDEMARRILWTRLDANVERPSQRNGWKIDDIAHWAKINRPCIIAACLTLVQAWIDAGKPLYKGRVKGSFEEWVKVMGGILQVIGVEGFLENEDELSETANTSNAAWRAFVGAWFEKHGMHPVTTKELFLIASHPDYEVGENSAGMGLLDEELGAGKEASRRRILGHALTHRKDSVIAGCKIIPAKPQNGLSRWALSVVNRAEVESEGY